MLNYMLKIPSSRHLTEGNVGQCAIATKMIVNACMALLPIEAGGIRFCDTIVFDRVSAELGLYALIQYYSSIQLCPISKRVIYRDRDSKRYAPQS
jgi:hypothetical protein